MGVTLQRYRLARILLSSCVGLTKGLIFRARQRLADSVSRNLSGEILSAWLAKPKSNRQVHFLFRLSWNNMSGKRCICANETLWIKCNLGLR